MTTDTIDIVPGAYEKWELEFTDEDEQPLDLTGATIELLVKNDFLDDDDDAIFIIEMTEHDDAENGLSSLEIEPENSILLGIDKYYKAIIRLTDADSHPHYPFIGDIRGYIGS